MNFENQYTWKSIGPSGGGQTRGACISPHDSDLIFVASDMGGVYRSADGGCQFALIDGKVLSRMNADFNITAVGFHPIEENTVYIGVWNGLFVSHDKGEHFEKADDYGMPYGPSRIVFNQAGNNALLVYNNPDSDTSVLKDMNGTIHYETENMSVGVAMSGDNIFLCGSRAQYLSADGGNSFKMISAHLIEGFCQDCSNVYYTTGDALYCFSFYTFENNLVYQRTDGKLRHVVSCHGKIYVGYEGSEEHFEGERMSTILCSKDNGKTFAPILFQHPARGDCNLQKSWISGKWGWYLSPSSLAMTPANPDMLLYTNFMGIGISRDGGKSFIEAGAALDGSAIQVMTSWNYVIDPHNSNIHYIPMTDFSGWRSDNKGQSWEHAWLGNPWKSNIYSIVSHPTIKGRLLAGTGTVHDLPYWHWLKKQQPTWGGGIIQSNDFGKTWFPQDRSGIGPFGIITDICYYKDKVFAAVLGQGLYVTDTTETYWKLCDKDIRHKNVARITVLKDDIYVVVWPQQVGEEVVAGAVYHSSDGVNFEEISLSRDIKYPVHVLPIRENEFYVSCFDCVDNYWRGRAAYVHDEKNFGKPGLYHTVDKGKTWIRVYDEAVYSAAYINDAVYICTRENGLFLMKDEMLMQDKELPIINPHTVTVDGEGNLYVTSFGQGVCKGTPKNLKEKKGDITR